MCLLTSTHSNNFLALHFEDCPSRFGFVCAQKYPLLKDYSPINLDIMTDANLSDDSRIPLDLRSRSFKDENGNRDVLYTADQRFVETNGLVPNDSQLVARGRRNQHKEKSFDIFLDETAQMGTPRRRVYMGSNVPALGDISNSQKFLYAGHHIVRRNAESLRTVAKLFGDWNTLENLDIIEGQDFVTLEERVLGYYDWVFENSTEDVWDWVQENHYHRSWTTKQQDGFKALLRRMKLKTQLSEIDPWKAVLGMLVTDLLELGIVNLAIQFESHGRFYSKISFCPTGEDKPRFYRWQFSRKEQKEIDRKWPYCWKDEDVKEHLNQNLAKVRMGTATAQDKEDIKAMTLYIHCPPDDDDDDEEEEIEASWSPDPREDWRIGGVEDASDTSESESESENSDASDESDDDEEYEEDEDDDEVHWT